MHPSGESRRYSRFVGRWILFWDKASLKGWLETLFW
jgi:hypothetical protein